MDQDTINDFILENFEDDNSDHYYFEDDEYYILEDREIRDQLYNKAEEYANDIVYDFELLLENNNHVVNKSQAAKSLKEEDLTDYISDALEYENEFNCKLVHETRDYTIFKLN